MNKKIYLSLAFLLTLVGMTSCEKDTPLPYDGMTGITFQPVNMFTDNISTGVTYPSESDTCFTKEFFFTYDESPEAYRVLTIPVAALGYTTDFDRSVDIEVDTDATTLPADRYEVASDLCSVSANNARGLLSILVKRPSMDVKDTQTLVIHLKPNTNFSYVLETGNTFTCKLSNTNHKPQYWDVSLSNGVNLTQTFGLYSNNKFTFIHNTLYDYSEEDWYGEVTYPYRDYATLEGFRGLCSNFYLSGEVQDVLQNAYKEYKENGGEPILDENTGKEIVFEY